MLIPHWLLKTFLCSGIWLASANPGVVWRWAEYFSSCRILCSHSNGETLAPCTSTCMNHSKERQSRKNSGKSYTTLVLWDGLSCLFLAEGEMLMWQYLMSWSNQAEKEDGWYDCTYGGDSAHLDMCLVSWLSSPQRTTGGVVLSVSDHHT